MRELDPRQQSGLVVGSVVGRERPPVRGRDAPDHLTPETWARETVSISAGGWRSSPGLAARRRRGCVLIPYVLAGLVLGGIYAIAAAGLVITYESTGILNFAFGSLAYFIARFYYYLIVQKGWSILPAATVTIVITAPVLGLVLYVVLFRFLRLSSSLIKVVATIGLSVALPALALLLFGNEAILLAPGLAPQPVQLVHLGGVAITMDQIIVYACVVATVVIGALVLRYTDVGLRVRAMVDSEAMTALSGTNPGAISAGVWAVSTFFAGLAGVLARAGDRPAAGQLHPPGRGRVRRSHRGQAAVAARSRSPWASRSASPARWWSATCRPGAR